MATTEHIEKAKRYLKGIIPKLQELQTNRSKSDLSSIHQMGQAILDSAEEIQFAHQLAHPFRIDVYELMAESCNLTGRTLRKYADFASIYDQTEIEELVTFNATWGHISHILTLSTKRERTEFLVKIRDQKLTIDELAKEIMAKHGNRRAGSGRRPKPPANLKKALDRLLDHSLKFENNTLALLFGDEFSLPECIEMEPPDELSTEVRDKIVNSVSSLKSLAAVAVSRAAELEETLERVEGICTERATEQTTEKRTPRRRPPSQPFLGQSLITKSQR